jgi:hypothetical protein
MAVNGNDPTSYDKRGKAQQSLSSADGARRLGVDACLR